MSVRLALLALLLAGCSAVEPASFTRTKHGFALAVEGSYVEIAVEGRSAFRITQTYKDSSTAAKSSPMISSKADPLYATFEIYSYGSSVSLRTKFGTATIDAQTGGFKLRDPEEQLLIDSPVLSTMDSRGYVVAQLSTPAAAGPYFGAGAAAGSPLDAQSSTPRVGNQYGNGAHSWLPQYYAQADRYGALVVGSEEFSATDDYWSAGQQDLSKYPANWTSDSSGGVVWTIKGASMDCYLMPAADVYAFRRAHAELTGAAKIPPRYAFGFMAGRWGWTSEGYIDETLHHFRDGKFPADGFISDFFFFTLFNDYDIPPTGNASYHDFGYNNVSWPDPVHQLEQYHQMGFHFGAVFCRSLDTFTRLLEKGIRKPRLGNDQYLQHARDNGWLLPKNLSNVNGDGRNINFTTAAARKWYQEQNQHYLDDGVDFWWNDEGEVTFFQFDGWNRAQAAGAALRNSSRRYFSLNRAYTPGMQQYGLAVWTGDISVSWESLEQQPGYLLNYGLSGMPYVGCDSGGFVGGNTSSELLARWYWSSAFMTLMRVHSTMNYDSTGHGGGVPVVPHFPWLYGDIAAIAMRAALEMRYQLIPFLYSLAHVAHQSGAPIMRPLLMEFSHDAQTNTITDQWLVGSGLMTAPILAPNGTRKVYLPALLQQGAEWYDFNSSTTQPGGQFIDVAKPLNETPLYCRSGTIVALGPVVQHTGELPGPTGELQLHVYAGEDGTFSLIEDDGESTEYEAGVKRSTLFAWNDSDRVLSWTVGGQLVHSSMFVSVTVRLFGSKKVSVSATKALGVDGRVVFK